MKHYKIICYNPRCGILLGQCRCPRNNKQIKYDFCSSCLPISFTDEELKNVSLLPGEGSISNERFSIKLAKMQKYLNTLLGRKVLVIDGIPGFLSYKYFGNFWV